MDLWAKVAVVQSFYLAPGVGKVSVVADDIIGDCEAVGSTRLSGENTARLFLGFGISCKQSLDLNTFVAIDDQNSIDVRP